MPKKWSRTTKGHNQQVFVSKPINYTAQATFAAFIANAAVGEIGVFNAANVDPALQSIALVTGDKFFIAQKVSGGTKRTPVYIWNTEATARKQLYVAPVLQTSALGWNGTGGALNNPSLVAGSSNYEFVILETTEGNDPFPNWNYNYTPKSGDTVVEAMMALAKQVNDTSNPVYINNNPLVTAAVRTTGTVTSFTITGGTTTLTFTKGSTLVAQGAGSTFSGVVGDYIITNAGAIPGNTNNNTYKIVAAVAGTSITLDRPWQEATVAMAQAKVQGASGGINKVATVTATGLIFTAINANETFRMAVRGDLVNADRFDLLTYTRGNGTYDEIFQLEDEGTTFQGNTAKNTIYGDAAYGNPDRFALSTDTYDYYYLDIKKDVVLSNSFHGGKANSTVVTASAKSAGNLGATFNTIFGV